MAEYDMEGEDLDTDLPEDSVALMVFCGWTDFDIDLMRIMPHENQCSSSRKLLTLAVSTVGLKGSGAPVSELIRNVIKSFRESQSLTILRLQLMKAMSLNGTSRKLKARATLFPSGDLDLPGVWHVLTTLDEDFDADKHVSEDDLV